MKKTFLCSMVILSTLGLVGCGPNPNTTGGTMLGAVAGGLIGSQFGGGSGHIAGALIGAAAGGYIGNRIGQSMDRQDQLDYRQAAMENQINQESRWTNHRTHRTYYVEPVREYHAHNHRCRRVKTTVEFDNGRTRDAYSTVCKSRRDGEWHFQS